MSEPPDADPPPQQDERLMAELARALGPDPLPDGLLGRAEGLLGYLDLDHRDLDHELAQLLEPGTAEPAGARGGAGGGTRLSFETALGSVSVELVAEPERLTGQLLAGDVTEVVLESVEGSELSAAVDALGRFTLPRALPGPVRLRLLRPPARPVLTDWFVI